jgi:hypothetical protein
MAFISKNRLQIFQDDPLTGFVYDGGTTCAAALEADKREFSPYEFHPRYMRCMAEYGGERAARDAWNLAAGQ